MDEYTRERYPHGVPYAEKHARPRRPPAPPEVIEGRRITLAGTADLTVQERGGDRVGPRRLRLLDAIRRWKA